MSVVKRKRNESQYEVKKKYREANKVKKLTQEQRIARIEEIFGIE